MVCRTAEGEGADGAPMGGSGFGYMPVFGLEGLFLAAEEKGIIVA